MERKFLIVPVTQRHTLSCQSPASRAFQSLSKEYLIFYTSSFLILLSSLKFLKQFMLFKLSTLFK